jgi:predicted AlkP superfamily pyrophosphatase or phosphodiesterase
MTLIRYFAAAVFTLVLLNQPTQALAQVRGDIKLILQITVDGLRGDLLQRYQRNFGEGGFNYLLDHGVVFTNAHYRHANTETIVGHATLATGAHPEVHGLVGNVWFDSETGELAYNIEDPDKPLLPTRESAQESEQVDPAQKQSRTQGRSPVAMLVPTFSDVLGIAQAGKAKIFAVSGKDRGAVPMAGQVGKAFWFSTDTGDFQTSTYYYDEYPDWVRDWNNQRHAESFSGAEWGLLRNPEHYLFGDQDDRPYEVDLKGYGRTFPHRFGEAVDPLFATRILVGPAGDRLTMDFSRALIDAEELGQTGTTDYLSISFSGVDACNHFFGPSSLENEDTVVQLDGILAELLQHVDQNVGLDNTLIVLSADHGMAEMPEYASENGYAAGRLYNEEVCDRANDLGLELFGIDGLCKTFFRPSLYLDLALISSSGLEASKVARALADALSREPGIGLAKATVDLVSRHYTGIAGMMKRNVHPDRSGDIYVAQSPYWFMFSKGSVAAMHGSPWSYDTHVPVIFAGHDIEPAQVDRLVQPADVAPTLSAFLGLVHPAGAQGSVLPEALGAKD